MADTPPPNSEMMNSLGHVCRPHTLTGSHLYSTKASEETVVVEEPPGMFKRFWKFMHSDESEYQVSDDQKGQVMLLCVIIDT